MSTPIVPAIIPSTEEAVVSYTKQLGFSHELHLDVVDGKFVTSISWPYSPQGEPVAIKYATDNFTLEVDLMTENPIPAARAWEKAGADMIIFHVETVDLESFIDFCKHSSASVGISFHGETTIETIYPYLEVADYIQVMGIEVIGSQGQPFSPRTLEKISILKQKYPLLPISVDGGVNKTTIPSLVKAGADRLIVGSGIVGQENFEAAYSELTTLVNESRPL